MEVKCVQARHERPPPGRRDSSHAGGHFSMLLSLVRQQISIKNQFSYRIVYFGGSIDIDSSQKSKAIANVKLKHFAMVLHQSNAVA